MKVGSMVYAKYPRVDGHSLGIVLQYRKGGAHHFGIIPDRVKVLWSSTGKTDWHRTWDLLAVKKCP